MLDIYFRKNWHKTFPKFSPTERAPMSHLSCGIVYSAFPKWRQRSFPAVVLFSEIVAINITTQQ